MEQLKKKNFDLIDIIVFAVYYLFVCFLFLALFGFFNRFWVILIWLVLFSVLIFLRRFFDFNKKYWLFFIVVPLVVAGFGFLRGFFVGDAYSMWLPFAKDIIVQGKLADFFNGFYLAREPLLSLLFAGTFSLFGSFNEFLCLWVPFFFTAATLILLLKWAKEKNLNRTFLFFLPLLFLTSSSVAYWGGWNLLQEAPLLFFTTAFFYYYEKYAASQEKKDLFLFFCSFVLMVVSKLTGLFFVLLIPFLFFKTDKKKFFLTYLFVFSLPLIFWFFRNYLIYDNPFFPLLNSLFRGRYYFFQQNSFFPGLLHTEAGAFSIFISVLKQFWLAFPFVLLSFYGFLKKKHYEYLFLFVLFFLFKEVFYFTITISVMRYYYLFFGLFLIYAFFGLEQIRSRLALTGLIFLAVAGLLIVPPTHSTSDFISLIENKFSLFGQLFDYLHNYWYLVLFVLAPFIYLAVKKEEIKIFLIFLYCFYLLHLSFIANKSWLNIWPFIFLLLIILIIFATKQRFKYFRPLAVALICLTVFINSWVLGAIYYWRHGFSFPVPHIWEESPWARQVLDQETSPAERKNFYILVSSHPGYFYWYSDYQAINLFDFNFWHILNGYSIDMSDQQLHQLFVKRGVKYFIENGEKYRYADLDNTEHAQLVEKFKKSSYFKLLTSQDNKYFIFRVEP